MGEKFVFYDSWDLTPPQIRPRSRLYPLEPMGVGTARSESCTSYIARLAAEHWTSVGSLFGQRLAPESGKAYLLSTNLRFESEAWKSFSPVANALNGLGATARDWIEVLETLTQRSELRFLTMLRWQNVLSEQSLSRSFHAWCPLCYQAQRNSGLVIYDHLLWSLVTVEICPKHKRRLETRCPHCQRQLHLLESRSRPGFCSRCKGWLGYAGRNRRDNGTPLGSEESAYKLWVAKQMGELITRAPGMAVDPTINKVTDFVPACIERLTNGNVCAFARLVDINKMTVHSWCYCRAVPRLDLLLRVCHRLGASLSELLSRDSVGLNYGLINQSLSRMPVMPLQRSHKNGEIRHALLAALKSDPAPTVSEVSASLGYKYPDFLYSKYSDLCKKLTARYRKSHRYLDRIRSPNRTQPDDETIKHALHRALAEPVIPSLQEVRKRLGYESRYEGTYLLRRKFPELCQSILERRASQRITHQNDLRRKLESSLREDPAPTLNDVGKRLGFKANNYLLKYYPELCRAIVIRHSEYRKAQFNSIPCELSAFLRNEPPVSLRAAAKQLGRNPAYLGSRFPKVCHAISKRYVLFKRKRSWENKKKAVKRFRAMALDLDSNGVYPSLERIKAVSRTFIGLTNVEAGILLRELRSQFKSIKGG